MILIKGKAEKVKKGKHRCPRDGIHRCKKSGRIRGFWGLKLSDTYIYYGNWAYYIDIGYKVFYSFKFAKTSKTEVQVRQTIGIMQQLKEFCPAVISIDTVETDISFNGRRHIAKSPAIIMQHVHYPENAWVKFAKGKPYNWHVCSHPDHSIAGFLDFRKKLNDRVKDIDYNFDSFSIGNIVWCTEMKRWYLVDVR